MPADVLAQAEEPAGRVEEAGRVQPAGRGEGGLGLAQPVGQARDERRGNGERALDARRVDRDRLQRPLPADPARRGRVEAALQPARIEAGRVDLDRCSRPGRPAARAAARAQPLREAEPEGELLVVPRRAHRHRHRAPADADLERLLDREQVTLRAAPRQPHDLGRRRAVRGRRPARRLAALTAEA